MTASLAKEHRTVSRVTTILEAVAVAPQGMSLAALATLLGAPKSSVHGLVQGLIATGYLDEGDHGYTIGPAVGMLASSGGASVPALAHRALEVIQRSCNESATLCTLVGETVVYLDRVESTQLIRYTAPLRVRRPLWPTSAGKCFLAHMRPTRRKSYLAAHFAEPEERARIEAELDEVVREGYATNRGETVPDVFAVASPIIISGRVLACLQVAGPGSRMADQMDKIAVLVRSEAQRLSRG
jgi:DNA-binding IclR family transcriptional regulator